LFEVTIRHQTISVPLVWTTLQNQPASQPPQRQHPAFLSGMDKGSAWKLALKLVVYA
jgi:hypothetical protein